MQPTESDRLSTTALFDGGGQDRLSPGSTFSLVAYGLTVFLSAFLLFQVQPIVAKFILPWFGGTPSVWTTCMLFFQVALFAGYSYAHFTSSRFRPRIQAIGHVSLLIAACLTLRIIPKDAWKPVADQSPTLRIVLLLGATVGIPFFVLSSTAPLLQGWFSRLHKERSTYRLYALSNAGSLLALVSYPFVFDWIFSVRFQAQIWSFGFAAFALLCAICAFGLGWRAAAAKDEQVSSPPSARPSLGVRSLWFALAMVPSVLLLATTNQVCLDIASVPFLWVLPLILYLLSFILCFDSDRWYSRRVFMAATALAMAGVYPVLSAGPDVPFIPLLLEFFALLFCCAMVCHGELVRIKPDTKHLTSFYLVISAGGAAGGILVGVIAPQVFSGYYELHAGLLTCAILMLVVLFTDETSRFFRARSRWIWLLALAGMGTFTYALVHQINNQKGDIVAVGRNFYGVIRVKETFVEPGDAIPRVRLMENGRILHGLQFQSPEWRRRPTSYFGVHSGVGRVLSQRTQGRARRVGDIGLGVGTLATYAEHGDHFRFYEINPMDLQMAREYFHFLDDCKGDVDVVLGDGRLMLERESPQNFDVLVLDAFSGDAVPVHLLTLEAFKIYLRHLAPDGIIVANLTNRYFSLRPVGEAIADYFNLASAVIDTEGNVKAATFGSSWILMSRDPASLRAKGINVTQRKNTGGASVPSAENRNRGPWANVQEDRRVLWTDDHASLFEVLW